MNLHVLPAGPIQTNAYLLTAPERGEAVLIDAPGEVWAEVGPILEAEKCKLTELWITHGHWDHTQGGAEVVTATGAKVLAHADDKLLIETPEVMEVFLRRGIKIPPITVDRWVAHGERLTALGLDVEVRHVPGHCPGNVLFYFAAAGAAFVGDALFNGSIGRTDLPGGSFEELEKSIREQIYTLPENTVVFPGHGPKTTVVHEREHNPMSATEHEVFMRRALVLARSVWGTTHPNPMVGAVIVEDGHIVGEGATAPDGGPHAERLALLNRGKPPRPGATLYVTMEPCCTHGRTGACTDAIIASGIKRVIVGATDPNPAHAGHGFDVMRAAGIEVVSGVLAAECTDLNLIFNHWITRGGPLLAAKSAVTLDGKIACRTGESRWISNEASRADVHRWRRLFPGIAVGAMTILKDNPRLTARRAGEAEWCPWRFVFDGLLRTVVDKNLPNVFTDEFRERTIVVTTPHGGLGYVRKLRDMGIKVWCLESATQRVSFTDFRKKCAEERIAGVYFEGGSQLVSELVRARQLDYLFAYRAPVLFADDKAKSIFSGLRPERVDQGVRLAEVQHEMFGDDALMRGRVVYPEKLQIDEAVFGVR